MIVPRKDDEIPAPVISVRAAVDAFFQPGGGMERACRASAFPFEPRPQQHLMAGAVADALETSRHLAVEAGTGVGKSFAYLVPLIHAAVVNNIQVVISTYTISLQEQLIHKDIPFLREHMGLDFKAVLVKGRSNYLCLRRLARARRMGGDLFRDRQEDELRLIETWADTTVEGSIQDMDRQPSSEVWSTVCAEHGNCLWQKCPEYKQCFFMKARSLVHQAHVLVVNHHLLFSELALRAQGVGFLPAYQILVIDEAHQMENVASEHMGIRLSQYGFEHWMRRLYVPESNKGILAYLKRGDAAHAVTRLWDEVADLYAAYRDVARLGAGVNQRVLSAPAAIETRVPERLGEIVALLKVIASEIEDDDMQGEIQSVLLRGMEMRNMLIAFMQQTCDDHVYWVEQEGQRRLQTVLYSAVIDVSGPLREQLFDSVPCVVMTSATLAVNGQLDYFQRRVGADDCEALSVGSPFDYPRQMRVHIPKGLPDPNDMEAFVPAAARAIEHYVRKTKGRAFVLFTSDRMMRRVADLVREPLTDAGLLLIMQGEGLPRHRMLKKFQSEEGCVLFGLDSFWMGVDVRGEALSNVIITRLPFAVPDQPIVKARMDRIRETGGDPFQEYSLPEAVLKFRQGVGRLIRTASDEGIIVILDQRILSKRYGRIFLQSIPECPVEIVDDLFE